MNTIKIDNYTFDKVSKTITFLDTFPIALENIISITNTKNNIQFFYSKLPNLGGTLDGQVLSVSYNTNNSNFNDSDPLLIEYVLDNYSDPIVPSSAKVVSGNSNSIINYGNKGVCLFIDTSASSGTDQIMTVKLQMLDVASGTWKDIPGAVTANITGVGSNLLTIYPGITASANVSVSFPLPRIYRVAWVVSGSTPSFTFSIGAHYIN